MPAQRPLDHWGETEHPSLRNLESPDGSMVLSEQQRPLAASPARQSYWRSLIAMKPSELARQSVLTLSRVTAEELNAVLADTGMSGLGAAFVAAEHERGVNALALAAIAAHESAWGRSALARNRHNLFGFGAYTGTSGRGATFASPEAGVDRAAGHLREQYLSPGGRYYRGAALADIGPTWAHDPKWAIKVAGVWSRLTRQLLELEAE